MLCLFMPTSNSRAQAPESSWNAPSTCALMPGIHTLLIHVGISHVLCYISVDILRVLPFVSLSDTNSEVVVEISYFYYVNYQMTKRQVFQRRFIVTALKEMGVYRYPWTVNSAVCIFLPSCSSTWWYLAYCF